MTPVRTPPVEQLLRARRAFVLASHPDRGGDPEAFRRGLAHFDERLEQLRATGSRPRVTVVRRPSRLADRVSGRLGQGVRLRRRRARRIVVPSPSS